MLRIAPMALPATAGIPNTAVLRPTPKVCTRELAAMQYYVIRARDCVLKLPPPLSEVFSFFLLGQIYIFRM